MFETDILNSRLCVNPPDTLSDLVTLYNTTLAGLLDKHAPLQSRQVKSNHSCPWFTPELANLKQQRRKLERSWNITHSKADLDSLRKATRHYHQSIVQAKHSFNFNLVQSHQSTPRRLWNVINTLLHRLPAPKLPTQIPSPILSQSIATFFYEKVAKLHSNLRANMPSSASTTSVIDPPVTPTALHQFQPVSATEISKLIMSSPDKQCELDPIPTFLLKKCINSLLPVITQIINMSLATGIFPEGFKHSIITPLLKKPSLDQEQLSNYRPVSNLSFLSKITEKVVKSRLDAHLTSNMLYNKFQSAYTKFHSTESTLLSLHDHLIQAISQQKLTCLCLLDLSAAFDTINHSILLDRLQNWFGLHGTVLDWFRSYLSSRTFTVLTNGIKSSNLPISCGVPQGSVLGPLLFIMYTTPLSHLLSTSSVHHHLYADDTQLFISFSPPSFHASIQLLQNSVSAVANWMSANLLCLNPSKSEFLVIGLPKQLSKLENPTLSMPDNIVLFPVQTARNLGFLFDSHLTLTDQIASLTKSRFYHIRDLRRTRKSLDLKTASTIATAIIHSKLDYCNSLYLNLPACHIKRLQLIQNAAARATVNCSRYHHITPILKSLHWLKVPQRIQYKVLSITYSVLQSQQPSYLHRLLSFEPTRCTRSSDVVTLNRPSNPSRLKITDRSFYYHVPTLWNSLPASLRQHSFSCSPFTTLALSPHLFHSKLKTYLFRKSYPPD